jgi:hypothetical protein
MKMLFLWFLCDILPFDGVKSSVFEVAGGFERLLWNRLSKENVGKRLYLGL